MTRLKLGATGEYPEGKLGNDDEGAIRLAVAHTRDGLVRIDFGKPVAWLAMSAEQARSFGQLLIAKANLAGPQ